MLYNNLLQNPRLFEYKLILESMLIDLGWFFGARGDTSQTVSLTTGDYAIYERTSSLYDAELARSASLAIANIKLEELEDIAKVPGENPSSVLTLKHYLLNDENIVTSEGTRPTPEDVDKLMRDFPQWMSKIYHKDTVKSVAASNPKIKLFTIKAFLNAPARFNNASLLRQNPHLADMLYADFVLSCVEHSSMMSEGENRPGHEGENYIHLISTLVYFINYFIPGWATKKLPEYITRNTVQGSGEGVFDQLDTKHMVMREKVTANIGKYIADIKYTDDKVFSRKTSQYPYYSIISWYQSIYLAPTLQNLQIHLQKFLAEKTKSPNTVPPSDDLSRNIERAIFNMSKQTNFCNGSKLTSQKNVILLTGRGTEHEGGTALVSDHFWKRFQGWITFMNATWRRLDEIKLDNLHVEAARMLPENPISNQCYPNPDSGKSDPKYAELREILDPLLERYGLKVLPSNRTVHQYATLIYGMKRLRDLVKLLNQSGYSVMDLPTEIEMHGAIVDSIVDLESMMIARDWSTGQHISRFNVRGKPKVIPLATNTELLTLIKTTKTEVTNTAHEIPLKGGVTTIVEPIDSMFEIPEKVGVSVYREHVIETRTQGPIFEPDKSGRAQFIQYTDVKLDAVWNVDGDLSTAKNKITRTLILNSLLFVELFRDVVDRSTMTSKESFLRSKATHTEKRNANTKAVTEAALQSLAALSKAKIDLRNEMLINRREEVLAMGKLAVYTGRIPETLYSGENWEALTTNDTLYNTGDPKALAYKIGLLIYLMGDNIKIKIAPEWKALLQGKDYKKLGFEEIQLTKNLMQLQSLMPVAARVDTLDNMCSVDEIVDTITTFDRTYALLRKTQDLFVTLGERALQRNNGAIIIGGASIWDTLSNVAIKARALKIARLSKFPVARNTFNSNISYRIVDGKLVQTNATAVRKTLPENTFIFKDRTIVAEIDSWVQTSNFMTMNVMQPDGTRQKKVLIIETDPEVGTAKILAERTSEFTPSVKSTHKVDRTYLDLGMFSPTGEWIEKSVIDIGVLFNSYLEVANSRISKQLETAGPLMLGLKLDAIPNLRDMICTLLIIQRVTVRTQIHVENYRRALRTFVDHEKVCAIKRNGSISDFQFNKNKIPLATYSDAIQTLLLKEKASVLAMNDFIYKLSRVKPDVQGTSVDNFYAELEPSNYAEPSKEYTIDVLKAYTARLIKLPIRINMGKMLRGVQDIEQTMLKLYHIENKKSGDTVANKNRFDQLRYYYGEYIKSREYILAALGSESKSSIVRRFHDRYAVDKELGVFYDPETLQYFLGNSADAQCMESSKFNVLVNSDGMAVILFGNKFYGARLEILDSKIIEALLY